MNVSSLCLHMYVCNCRAQERQEVLLPNTSEQPTMIILTQCIILYPFLGYQAESNECYSKEK